MMSNLSSTLSLKPTATNLAAAKTWATKSLDTIERVLVTEPEFSIGQAGAKDAVDVQRAAAGGVGKGEAKEAMGRKAMCESVRSVALFNLGLLAEVRPSPLLPPLPSGIRAVGLPMPWLTMWLCIYADGWRCERGSGAPASCAQMER